MKYRSAGPLIVALIFCVVSYGLKALSQQPSGDRAERVKRMSKEAETRGLAEPFKGVTTDGNVIPGLFPIRSTGVSIDPVRKSAAAFLSSLSPEQRAMTSFKVDDPEWRKWMNQHFYVRQGMGFKEMNEAQTKAALAMLRASLSAKGMKLSQDIMRLNTTLAELNENNFEEYGEQLYWITIMGEPSQKEPWGWQLDGHHLIINYFVLGDQVVMSPAFFGSEPVIAHAGKHKGVTVLQDEQNKGLALINALNDEQRKKAIIQVSKTGNNNVGEAFKDNIVLEYKGIRAVEFDASQKAKLLDLINEYVRNMDDGHAKVKMNEVKQRLDDTHFAWIGETGPSSVFYYRIQSPVILIEFDHQVPVGLRRLAKDPRAVDREHVHTVLRTPNGNDYGKDLLKQHYLKHPHPHDH